MHAIHTNRTCVTVAVAMGALALAFSLGRADTTAQTGGPEAPAAPAGEQNGSAFTYQGQLRKNGAPVNESCNASFSLWDAAQGGAQIGGTVTSATLSVYNGLFTIPLDFGWGAFNGEARWLETAIGCGEAQVTLTPRTDVRPAPYALALPGMRTVPGNTDSHGFPTMNVIGGVISGTISNSISADSFNSSIGGGYLNRITAQSDHSAIGGGWFNRIDFNSYRSTIGTGYNNLIYNSNHSAIGSGGGNTILSAQYAAIPGGSENRVDGDYGLAAGRRAKALHDGTFVWADSTNTPISSTAANQFIVRASGGVTMFTNAGATIGARLASGSGSWTNLSDRAMKANVAAVDPRAVLEAVAALPVSTWNYTSQDAGIRHIGPMAQDFYVAFGVGESDTGISTVDGQGVALAAIQGLNAKLESENAELRARNEALETRLDRLERSQASAPPDLWSVLLGALALGGAGAWAAKRPRA